MIAASDKKQDNNISNTNLWCNYLWNCRSYLISCLENHADQVVGKEWVIRSIEEIAQDIKVEIGEINSFKIICFLHNMFSLLHDKVDEVKTGKDSLDVNLMDIAFINSFSDFLHSVNPSWKFNSWYSSLELLYNLMINQIAARIAGEWDLHLKYHYAALQQFEIIYQNIISRK